MENDIILMKDGAVRIRPGSIGVREKTILSVTVFSVFFLLILIAGSFIGQDSLYVDPTG